MPRFSIIVTCYNQREVIAEAVDSALAQDYRDREIIVVDDGSTDGSAQRLEKYGSSITLSVSATNAGAEQARNRGAALARGEFLVFLDGDDRLLPGALATYSRVADDCHPKLILARLHFFAGKYSEAAERRPGAITAVVHPDYFKKDRAFRASASAMVIERSAFQLAGGWTQGTFPADDQDLLFKLGESGPVAQIVGPETAAYRMHEGNATRGARSLIDATHRLLARERQGYYPGGRKRRPERRAVIGGFLFFMVKRAWRSGLYGEAFKLLGAGWPTVGAATLRRAGAMLRGRRPEKSIPAG